MTGVRETTNGGTGHDRYRELAAAHIVGALEPAERAELEMHLGGCDACRRELLELAPIPALLARLDLEEVEAAGAAAPGADAVVDAVRREVGRMTRSRRRWRAAAAAGAVAATVALVAALGSGDPPPRRFDGTALEVVAASSTEARVLADEREWGTYVWISARGLPPRDAYVVWVVGGDGGWERAGTFAPTPDGAADLGGSTRLPLSGIDRVVVTSTDRADELLSAG